MARARNIKPGFFKNPELVELPYEYRLLFIGLWTLADREGYLEDRPKQIKMEVFPADNLDVDKGLEQLQKLGFVHRYTVGESRFLCVCKFLEHQHPHHLEKPSTIPKPGANPSDSLIPDSLKRNPDKPPLSGKPDAKPDLKSQAKHILSFLNEKTGKNFHEVDVHLERITGRLKEGYTVGQCKQVIAQRARMWGKDEKMVEYLRPATLFARENFSNYVGELVVQPVEAQA